MAGSLPVSPLAPAVFPDLPEITGVEYAAIEAGVRYANRTDVMLAKVAPGSTVAGVFTRSATRAAPVLDCQAKLAAGSDARAGAAFLVNSGNANAFTGAAGEGSVAAICSALAGVIDVPEGRIFTASTGVIGERLPHDRVISKLDELASGLSAGAAREAAEAIRTTDTFAKGAGVVIQTPDGEIRIAGFAKGSGMIAPDMATMLVYIFTDAAVPQPVLQQALSSLNETTFNAITVDSDTSTSDTLLIAATGQGPASVASLNDPTGEAFLAALNGVMLDLAHQVVRDGEGATKFLEIKVTGAINEGDAKRAAMAIANSPLVKTAVAGEDPNWGRVVMAVGKSGVRADRDLLSIWFGDNLVAEKGWVAESYTEEVGANYMKAPELRLSVDLGLGHGTFTAWTCDLTHGYISINADYRS